MGSAKQQLADPSPNYLREIFYVDNTLRFIPEEPKAGDDFYDNCRDWNVSFTATLKEDSNGERNIMDLQGGGTFCGCNGGTNGTFWDEIIRQ